MAHTPGPWLLQINEDRPIVSKDGCEMFGAIASIYTGNPGGDPADNARLIAAAPELLAACEDWQRYFDKLMEHDEPGDPLAEMRNSFHKERVDRTRAAISKTRGQ